MYYNKSLINSSLTMKKWLSDVLGFVMEQYLVGHYLIIAEQQTFNNTLCNFKVKWNEFKPYLVSTRSSCMIYSEGMHGTIAQWFSRKAYFSFWECIMASEIAIFLLTLWKVYFARMPGCYFWRRSLRALRALRTLCALCAYIHIYIYHSLLQ